LKLKIEVEKNPYPQVYVDLTTKCNMRCNLCYNPWPNEPDLDLGYFEEVCKRLPNKVFFRLLGGEPTISENFFDFVRVARKYKHLTCVTTNGVRFADISYAKEFRKHARQCVVALSMDGGLDDEFYKRINGSACKDIKMQALENLESLSFRRVGLNCTIIRGLNESVVSDSLHLCKTYKALNCVHYRSENPVGRWLGESEKYNVPELEELVNEYIPIKDPYRVIRDGKTKTNTCNGCGQCKLLWATKSLQFLLVDPGSKEIKECPLRGKLNQDFTLTSFFKSMLVTQDRWRKPEDE